jgi:hypothetical protein
MGLDPWALTYGLLPGFLTLDPTPAKGVVAKQAEQNMPRTEVEKQERKFKHEAHKAHEEERNLRLAVDRIVTPSYG